MFVVKSMTTENFQQHCKTCAYKVCSTSVQRTNFVWDTYKTTLQSGNLLKMQKELCLEQLGMLLMGLFLYATGPNQKCPNDFCNELKSPPAKASFLRFLVEEWRKDAYADQLWSRADYVGIAPGCFKFKVHVQDRIVSRTRSTEPDLSCQHEGTHTEYCLAHQAYL